MWSPRDHPPDNPAATLAALCARAAAFFDVTERELASNSQRRPALAARAVVCDVAVSHHALPLAAVARHLSIARPSVSRALERAPAVYAEHNCSADDFLQR